MQTTINVYQAAITSREREILRLVSYEHSSKEIADKLYIAHSTVITHRQNLMNKLKVKNTAGMVRKGFEEGILTILKNSSILENTNNI